MSKQKHSSTPNTRSVSNGKRLLKQILAVIWLFVRSFFWVKHWFVWANDSFPDPREDDDALFSKANSVLIVLLFIAAYAGYGAQQLQGFGDFVNNFLQSFTWVSLANTTLFIIVLYLIFAFQLRVRGKHFWRPLGFILLPFSMMLTLFLIAYSSFQGFDAAGISTLESVVWAAVIISLLSSSIGFLYIMYRAVKTRMNTYGSHPVIGPLIELALSLKSLIIASQGKALLLWLPHVPSRLLALLPPAIAIVFYTHHAVKVERGYMKRRQTSFAAELRRVWKQISNIRRPLKNRLKDLWEFRKTQTFSFGLCLVFLFIALLFPSGMMEGEFFHDKR